MTTRHDLAKNSTEPAPMPASPEHTLNGSFGAGLVVNDVQSQLNATQVNRILQPTSLDAIQAAVHVAQLEDRAISIAGGRHAMGGQQFGSDSILLDMSQFNRVVEFDPIRGQIEVQSGIEWPN